MQTHFHLISNPEHRTPGDPASIHRSRSLPRHPHQPKSHGWDFKSCFETTRQRHCPKGELCAARGLILLAKNEILLTWIKKKIKIHPKRVF